jgi:hypothetical protein
MVVRLGISDWNRFEEWVTGISGLSVLVQDTGIDAMLETKKPISNYLL